MRLFKKLCTGVLCVLLCTQFLTDLSAKPKKADKSAKTTAVKKMSCPKHDFVYPELPKLFTNAEFQNSHLDYKNPGTKYAKESYLLRYLQYMYNYHLPNMEILQKEYKALDCTDPRVVFMMMGLDDFVPLEFSEEDFESLIAVMSSSIEQSDVNLAAYAKKFKIFLKKFNEYRHHVIQMYLESQGLATHDEDKDEDDHSDTSKKSQKSKKS